MSGKCKFCLRTQALLLLMAGLRRSGVTGRALLALPRGASQLLLDWKATSRGKLHQSPVNRSGSVFSSALCACYSQPVMLFLCRWRLRHQPCSAFLDLCMDDEQHMSEGNTSHCPHLLQGSAKGGMLADPFPAATASLLDWTAAVSLGKEKASLLEAPLLLKVSLDAHSVPRC